MTHFSGKAKLSCFLIGFGFLILFASRVVDDFASESFAQESKASVFQFQVNDRIAVLGNGLADRMQHDGWLEAHLQLRLPRHQLSVRNLGFTGDELNLRMRSSGFGSPEQWLQRTNANVVLAFFGYNESFRGSKGLPAFKKQLKRFIETTCRPAEDSSIKRRLVLFTPTAYEDLSDPLLPEANKMNEQLRLYADAMTEVAREMDVSLVDLFRPTLAVMQSAKSPLTINGIHFQPEGNLQVARAIDKTLFSTADPLDAKLLDQVRKAICDKNFHWFQRYRTTDGYSIFGGRKNTGGSRWTPDNEKVMQREMEILDTMTANRDQHIWSLARGENSEVDDSNLPPLIPVASNKPGPLGDGSYPFLSGEEAIEKMTVRDGLEVNLFASEEKFPELQNPVQAAVDPQGRLWVAAWPSYPHWRPTDQMNDKLLIFEDQDGDGQADKCKVFADGLHNPTGFEFYDGGVYVAQIPDIWFFKDTDGDDVADVRRRVIGGVDSADTHHSINSFTVGPGGGIYFQEGVFHRTQVETPHGPPTRVADAGVFRYDPRDQSLTSYANYAFANPHGHVFNYWGEDIIHDGTSARPLFGPAISGRTIFPVKHRSAPLVYDKRTRPCAATAILSSSHFPEDVRDDLLVCNVIGFQGVLQYRLEEDGAGVRGVETQPLIWSSDPNFRPVDLEIGADGAVYMLDWQNPLIGHLQHNLRDSNRDHRHGRIYRIRHQERALLSPPAIADQPIEKLLDLLQQRDNGIRYRAKIELSRHDPSKVTEACQRWIEGLDQSSEDYQHHLLEALWVHQHNHVINEPLLMQLLSAEDDRVRAAAAHVLRAWRKELPNALELVSQLVRDSHPKVRLAGVLLCSDIDSAEAAELALETAKQSPGRYLDYALTETTRTLKPYWEQAIAGGQLFCESNPEAIKYLLRCTSADKLTSVMTGSQLLSALVIQPDLEADQRYDALLSLAKQQGTKPIDELLAYLNSSKSVSSDVREKLANLLARFEVDQIRGIEQPLLQLASSRQAKEIRPSALASLARIDGNSDRVWRLATGKRGGLFDLLSCLQFIPETETRQQFYDRVRPLMIDPASIKTRRQTPALLSRVRAAAITAMSYIPGNEAQKIDDLLTLLEKKEHRSEILLALRTVPQNEFRPDAVTRLITATTNHLATIDAPQRAAAESAREVALALELTETLTTDAAQSAREKLSQYAVRILKLSTIPHRMAYDQQELVVQAGEPVQLLLENPDNMPHNFVLVAPGRLEKVGQKAEAMATSPSRQSQNFVPQASFVLASSKLLESQSEQILSFTAPKRPGIYPYVCTYPGHWRRMFGSMIVVANLDQYEQDPTTYLATHKIRPQDELLKYNRPLKNWKYDELAPALDRLAEHRNFDRGSKLYETASCAACHSVANGQSRFAPNLTKLDEKRTPLHILRSIVEPSHTIEKKYQMSKVLLDTGKLVVGLAVEETEDELVLMIDPLVKCEPTILDTEEVEEIYASDISLMPAGLLDRFTEEEILELLAFIVSRGDRNHEVYQSN